MHKGVNGRWQNMLSSEDIERYEQEAREKLGVDCAYWLSTGRLQHMENALTRRAARA
jgi:aryl sulfotransferase